MDSLGDWLTFLLVACVVFGLMFLLGSLFDEIDMLRGEVDNDVDDIGF